jgi:tetratricopeptide (TPR) repeat protein
MAKRKKETHVREFENVQNALSKSEAFVEKNKTVLLGGLVAVILVVGAVLFYRNQVFIPKQQEAREAIFRAEQYFVKDSFQLALNGDGVDLGFLAIIDEYGMTDVANLAKAYAGVCYKMLGEYENAVPYLNEFDASDMSLSPALKGAIGDCYLEMGEKDKAASFFQKAIDSNNDVISPIYLYRMGLLYYSMGEYKKAVSAFDEIKNKYASSQLAMDIDKYIQLATLKQQ